MKLLARLFPDFRRAVFSVSFAAAVFFMALLELLSSGLMLKNPGFTVVEILDNLFGGTGASTILIGMLPLLPYALSYAKDMEEHALCFYMAREDTAVFMLCRFFTACFSALLSVMASFFVLAAVLMSLGYPLYTPQYFVDNSSDITYMQFLADEKPLSYMIFYSMDKGLGAAMMAGCAVFLSTLVPNSFFVFCAPICIYFLALRLFTFPIEMTAAHPWLNVSSWIESGYSAPTAMESFLCKLGVACLVLAVYGSLSVFFAVRRWHYE